MAEAKRFELLVHIATYDELATRWFKPAHPRFLIHLLSWKKNLGKLFFRLINIADKNKFSSLNIFQLNFIKNDT